MSSIQEIEAAIEALPAGQFLLLREHIQRRFDQQWDRQFEEDVASGRLDAVAAAAIAEHRAGRSTPFPFEEARTVFYDEHALLIPDPDHSTTEDRFIIMGLSSALRVLVIVHCFRKSGSSIRVISARRAGTKEEQPYWEKKK